MAYRILPFSENLDLNQFYITAKSKGFKNNSNQQMLVDCFRKEREWQVWILFYNDLAVGSVAAHSIEEGYRICARTCVLSELLPLNTLRTKNQIITHQHVTAQFFMPTCINWVNNRGDIYITSHPSNVGTQRLVHNIWGPSLEKTGVLKKSFEKFYRGHLQTFWKLNSDVFLEQLKLYPRWSELPK